MRILPSISQLMRKELKSILAEKYYDELCKEIDKKVIVTSDRTNQRYSIILECKNFEDQSINYNYEIDINSDYKKQSKIFRISAQNQRYKTTALLIIAILLGYDIKKKNDFMIDIMSFDDKKNILNNDRLLQRLANLKDVMFNFESESDISFGGRKIKLNISCNHKDIITINIDSSIKVITEDGTERIINYKGNKTYDEYLRYISELGLFTPYLISKGRDFVKYILVEETKKYWMSLDLLIKVIQNKQVKWAEFSRRLTDSQINEKIKAIEFLIRVSKQYPNYLKYRNDYTEYIKLKSVFDKDKTYNSELLIEYQKQITSLSNERTEVINRISNILNFINDKTKYKYVGSFKEQINKVDLLFSGFKPAPSLGIKVINENTQVVKVRPIKILYEVNNSIINKEITDFDKLLITFSGIEDLQKDYYTAWSYYKENRDTLIILVKRLDELDILIRELELKKKNIEDVINNKIKFDLLKNRLTNCLEELESLQTYHIETIEKNIEIAKPIDFDELEASIITYKRMLKSDNFDISRLEQLLTNITNSYQFFGKEMSKLSKKDENYTISRPVITNSFIDKIIETFEKDIVERCSFFLKTTANGVRVYQIKKYSFWEQVFYSEDDEILDLQSGLSGGTDSVMTVCSIASSLTDSKYGNVLLIDEWGDVSESFHKETIKELYKLKDFAFAIFVDINDLHDIINISVEGDEIV